MTDLELYTLSNIFAPHREAANREGWDLVECEGGLLVQRIDDPEDLPSGIATHLPGDTAAQMIVRTGTGEHHRAASDIIWTYFPEEWEALNQAATAYQEAMPADKRWPTLTVPAISIHHLTKQTVNWIRCGNNSNDLGFPCAATSGGSYFVALPSCEKHLDTVPDDLLALFKAATEHAIDNWILLDIDGDEIADLPLYKD